MTNQDYVTFDTAKLLKEAGYPQRAFASWYSADKELLRKEDGFMPIVNQDLEAPSLWDAMKWLREEKEIEIEITVNVFQEQYLITVKGYRENLILRQYVCTFKSIKSGKIRSVVKMNYEAACDASVTGACEWLLGENHSKEA